MLKIQTAQEEEVTLLLLDGVVDISTCRILLARLETEINQGKRIFVFDLEHVHLLDSTGIGELYYYIIEHDIEITLVNTPPFIEETLEIVGLFDILEQKGKYRRL
jgi:anti-anti-sigma factor